MQNNFKTEILKQYHQSGQNLFFQELNLQKYHCRQRIKAFSKQMKVSRYQFLDLYHQFLKKLDATIINQSDEFKIQQEDLLKQLDSENFIKEKYQAWILEENLDFFTKIALISETKTQISCIKKQSAKKIFDITDKTQKNQNSTRIKINKFVEILIKNIENQILNDFIRLKENQIESQKEEKTIQLTKQIFDSAKSGSLNLDQLQLQILENFMKNVINKPRKEDQCTVPDGQGQILNFDDDKAGVELKNSQNEFEDKAFHSVNKNSVSMGLGDMASNNQNIQDALEYKSSSIQN